MRNGYLLKIVPPAGYRVFRLEFTRRHVAFAGALLAVVLGALCAANVWALRHAEARVGELRSLTNAQRRELQSIDARAAALDHELGALRRQNDQIRKIIDAPANPPGRSGGSGTGGTGTGGTGSGTGGTAGGTGTGTGGPHAFVPGAAEPFAVVAARIERIRRDSQRMRSDADGLRGLALRVLNGRLLAAQARARVLAAIPSINPAGAAAIASSFGWRTAPWPEFHQGVDLDANYGDGVRAAAAGTVVAAGYDGGYGVKVDIDHGNGYHTWYCHLSRADVTVGAVVKKGDHIALVGSTGASTGPHLHYQIMLAGRAIDPTPYLQGIPTQVLASVK